jgi:predicted nuclease with TOPRIM domain
MGRTKKKEPQTEIEKLRERLEYLEAENALLKKVRALVEAREARLKGTGQEPSTN